MSKLRLASAVAVGVLLTSSFASVARAGDPTPVPFPSASETALPDNPADWTPPTDWEIPDPAEDVELPPTEADDWPGVPTGKPNPTATDTTNANPDCPKGRWVVVSTKRFNARLSKVGSNFSSYFGNGGTQTLSAGVSGTLTATASTTLEGSLSAASIVTAKAQFGATLSASATVTGSIQESQTVKKGYWGNAFWGATKLPVTFHSQFFAAGTCKMTQDKKYTMWYPFKPAVTVGWCKWVSKTSLGSRPAACNASGYLPA